MLNYIIITAVLALLAVVTIVLLIVFLSERRAKKAEAEPEAEPEAVDNPATLADETDSIQRHEGDHGDSIGKIPINISTQGETEYSMVGVLSTTNDSQQNVQTNIAIPLFGKRLHGNSHRWNYYTLVNDLPIMLEIENKDCSDENTGCDELSNGDTVVIPELGEAEYNVTVYPRNKPRYIPL